MLSSSYRSTFASDVELVSWTVSPGASNPLVAQLGATETLTVAVRNKATAGVGNNIAAVTGTRRNFLVTAFYSSADTPSTSVVGTASTVTLTTADRQQALTAVGAAGATSTLSGSIAYATIISTDCPNANFVCLTIAADTANNAAYIEATGTLADNTKCNALTVSCYPGM